MGARGSGSVSQRQLGVERTSRRRRWRGYQIARCGEGVAILCAQLTALANPPGLQAAVVLGTANLILRRDTGTRPSRSRASTSPPAFVQPRADSVHSALDGDISNDEIRSLKMDRG